MPRTPTVRKAIKGFGPVSAFTCLRNAYKPSIQQHINRISKGGGADTLPLGLFIGVHQSIVVHDFPGFSFGVSRFDLAFEHKGHQDNVCCARGQTPKGSGLQHCAGENNPPARIDRVLCHIPSR